MSNWLYGFAFDFTSGSQIALMEQFEGAAGLYPRQQLRLVLRHELGVELGLAVDAAVAVAGRRGRAHVGDHAGQ
jgi:hypothetical protein